LMDLAQTPVNGSGIPVSQLTMPYNGAESSAGAVVPTETFELEVQDSTNATV
jgi:hypothetical protein